MNKLLHLVFLDFKLLAKSKTFYLKLILFPTALVLILGTIFKGSDTTLTNFTVAFYSQDASVSSRNTTFSFGDMLKNDVFKSKDIKSTITLKEVNSYDEGKKLVDKKTAAVFVYLPKDFTNSFVADKKTNVTIVGSLSSPKDKSIVENILERFIKNIKTIFTEEDTLSENLNSNTKLTKEDAQKIIEQIENDNGFSTTLSKISTNNNKKPISIMQYVCIGITVMFSLLTAFILVHRIVDDRLNNTIFRIKSTPTLNIQYALGKLTGIVFAMVMQMTIVIIVTSLVFSLNWGNVLYILLITTVYSFCLGSAILLWGLVAKNQTSVSSLASPILYGFSFLGGSFISKDALPDSLQPIQAIIPNGKAINCYLNVCQGMGLNSIYKDLIALLIIGLIFLGFALSVYNGRMLIKNGNSSNNSKAVKTAA